MQCQSSTQWGQCQSGRTKANCGRLRPNSSKLGRPRPTLGSGWPNSSQLQSRQRLTFQLWVIVWPTWANAEFCPNLRAIGFSRPWRPGIAIAGSVSARHPDRTDSPPTPRPETPLRALPPNFVQLSEGCMNFGRARRPNIRPSLRTQLLGFNPGSIEPRPKLGRSRANFG